MLRIFAGCYREFRPAKCASYFATVPKDRQYDFHRAFALFKKFAAKAAENLTVNEHYDIALSFLKQCGEAGLFYE